MLLDTDPGTDASPPESPDEHTNTAGEEAHADELIDVADTAGEPDETNPAEPHAASAERSERLFSARILAYVVLPGLALILALAAGYLKWQDNSARLNHAAATQSVQAATDGTIALLSYRADTVDNDLATAADRLTGTFRDSYTQLINTVVAPGAKQQHISAVATVPGAGLVSATEDHAVVLVLVNQTTTIGSDPPTNTASSVRVTLDKVHNRWLISRFDPV